MLQKDFSAEPMQLVIRSLFRGKAFVSCSKVTGDILFEEETM